MNFYIATKLNRSNEHNELRDILLNNGHSITYDWTTHCSVKNDGEDILSTVSDLELNGVKDADLVIVLLPGGRGTHCEIGIALGANIPVILHSEGGRLFQSNDDTCVFYWSTGVTQYKGTLNELASFILKY
jgi:nucleoside 2-deoxyribosyltransferase